MSLSKENDKPDNDQHLEFLEWVVRYQDGALTPAEVAKLSESISQDPAKRKLFRRMQIRTTAIHDLLRLEAFGQSNRLLDHELQVSISPEEVPFAAGRLARHKILASRRRTFLLTGATTLALLVLFGVMTWKWPGPSPAMTQLPAPAADAQQVILVEEIRAKFFGQGTLNSGDVVQPLQDYLLQSGLVKLRFPSGAIAILEAPSIFQVATQDRLVLNTGACSVHAPPGAEGFEVITPLTKVVDRGTRFYVRVQENNETEVHVIEGAADLYPTATASVDPLIADASGAVRRPADAEATRLTNGEAIRVGGFLDSSGQRMKFHSETYRAQLPDRLVDYQASYTPQGTADELTSVTVQRNGQLHSYSAEELIPIEVASFRADSTPDANGYLCGFQNKPDRPEEWLEDRKLATGLINFGGQPAPLAGRPVSNSHSEETPGLGIRFLTPVVNHAGPDLVLFEIQSFSNQPDGDPFHIYPLADRTDLKPFTVTKFDLTMDSPAAREVAPLWSHRFPTSIGSLAELKEAESPIKVDVSPLHFHVIGVGIDLSDLGFAEGDEVNELFLQHAADEKASKLDPVFIAGLPPLIPDK
ncbi:FecR domain-containing protein [Planctomicrobium piriforme]|uniref:FecR protein n=1 Tax=Planctomicrobium piriforme TaxID=1576369 RepID=A0A1I3MZK7_9PLAN|nr:FecR domain-containing protein [Planctomicrobium piriforme]SFJ02419.1 FecR protein [Planctomicrobium piriforme]